MAEKNVILKDGEDILYPKTKAELVEGLPEGGAEWGDITGTLSNQTDLQTALDGKLSLSGGTMTGDIRMANQASICTSNGIVVIKPTIGQLLIGSTGQYDEILFKIGASGAFRLKKGINTYNILSGENTAANEPLAGTEADLTSLKLNGTTYKVPSGGGGGGPSGYTVTLYHKSGNKLFMVYSDNSYELITMTDSNAHVYNNVVCFYLDTSDQAYAELRTGGGNGYLVSDYNGTGQSQYIMQLGGLQLAVCKYTVYGDLTANIYGGGN